MTRIEPPRRPGLFVRLVYLGCRMLYGRVLRPLQIAAHRPSFILPFMMTNRFGHGRSALPGQLRLLAMQLVGERNGCHWCIDFGRSLARGEDRAKIAHVAEYATHPAFSAAERAALRYADETTAVPVVVSDETFAELRRHFDERQIVELTYAIAIESFYNRVNAPLGVEPEGFCAFVPAGSTDAAAVERRPAA